MQNFIPSGKDVYGRSVQNWISEPISIEFCGEIFAYIVMAVSEPILPTFKYFKFKYKTFHWAKQIVGKKFYLNQTILFMTEQIGKAPYSSIV